MKAVEAIEQWLKDHEISYSYYHQTAPYQIRIDGTCLIIVAPGPSNDETEVVVWQTKSHRRRFDTHLNIADPEFFQKFEMSIK